MIHGPIGQKVSIALENENTPICISLVRWMSRAVMSLKTVYPAMELGGLVGAEELAAVADDDRELELVVEFLRQPPGDTIAASGPMIASTFWKNTIPLCTGCDQSMACSSL